MNTEKEMSDFLSDARTLLGKIEATVTALEKQNQSFQLNIEKDFERHRERIDEVENKWRQIRNVVISLIFLSVGGVTGGGIAIDRIPTKSEIKDEYTSKEQSLRGIGRVIENTFDVMEHKELITPYEQNALEKETQEDVLREIDPNYVTRGVK